MLYVVNLCKVAAAAAAANPWWHHRVDFQRWCFILLLFWRLFYSVLFFICVMMCVFVPFLPLVSLYLYTLHFCSPTPSTLWQKQKNVYNTTKCMAQSSRQKKRMPLASTNRSGRQWTNGNVKDLHHKLSIEHVVNICIYIRIIKFKRRSLKCLWNMCGCDWVCALEQVNE